MLKSSNLICCIAAAALACMHAGCAEILKSSAKDVTPAVVSSAVKELASPGTQHQLVAAVDENHVKMISARFSAGFVDGVLDSLEDPARRARLEAIVNGIVANASGTAIDSMLTRALDDKVQMKMRLAMRATTGCRRCAHAPANMRVRGSSPSFGHTHQSLI